MRRYELTPIVNLLEALEIARIRNDCRAFMTHDNSWINPIRQSTWYLKKFRKANSRNEMLCFLFKSKGRNVGFGFIRKYEGKYWITGGLKSRERGKGMGKILFSEIIKKVPSKEVWLEVQSTNELAKHIYKGLGFEYHEMSKKNVDSMFLIK